MSESYELRKANDRADRKRQRMADYRQRTKPARERARDKRRQLDLMMLGVAKGWTVR